LASDSNIPLIWGEMMAAIYN